MVRRARSRKAVHSLGRNVNFLISLNLSLSLSLSLPPSLLDDEASFVVVESRRKEKIF
jgi:hypothetical protein